ncbi:hypothetical protein Acr_03g0005720 [Actinidia rufa]|uniref:Leucine-rich repeat (LRR) family protein n=1 Tax=Actinidia rufa TaxID=165716 RepID=A0A7J0EBF8_9ERIC|nr:hypothetical protein Acr_03g0005720 [Actinidia rufa]
MELSLLTRLVVLDLSSFHFPGTPSLQLENPNLVTFLRNLPGVIELYLDGVNISASGNEWCQSISSSVPNLKVLSLSNCYLSGPMDVSLQKLRFLSEINLGSNNLSAPVPEFFVNFRNLTALILSSSNLNGAFPEKIFQVPTLQTLDLENNRFIDGSLPEFPKNSNLQKLVLSGTNFSSRLPDSMGNLTKLSRMEIAGCNFSGMIPSSMANLTQLAYVDMRSNVFTGPIPSFQMSKNLSYIDLSHNNLAGGIGCPGVINNTWPKLQIIDLALNNFSGDLPPNCFLRWKAMQVDMGTAQPDLNHLGFEFLMLNHFYYQDTVTVTMKGLGMELVKILTVFTSVDFSCNEGLCGSPLNTRCSNSSTPPSSNKSDSVSRTVFDWKFIYTGLGFGMGAGFVVGPLVFWKKLSHWCDEHIERFVRMILPTLGFLFPCCNDVKDEADDNVDEVSSDEDYDEMEDQAFQGSIRISTLEQGWK